MINKKFRIRAVCDTYVKSSNKEHSSKLNSFKKRKLNRDQFIDAYIVDYNDDYIKIKYPENIKINRNVVFMFKKHIAIENFNSNFFSKKDNRFQKWKNRISTI